LGPPAKRLWGQKLHPGFESLPPRLIRARFLRAEANASASVEDTGLAAVYALATGLQGLISAQLAMGRGGIACAFGYYPAPGRHTCPARVLLRRECALWIIV
jgi:hypothetical protein